MTGAVHHPVFARLYMRAASPKEEPYRRRLLAGLSGQVIEVGCGHGLNFQHYPAQVTRVLAVEPEAVLRTAAQRAARSAPVRIEVIDGVAEQLPVGDATHDAAVTSLVLCSVGDQSRALAEIRRVLVPGGRLHFYEHVASDRPRARRLQQFCDRTFWPHVAGGCHLTRDTTSAIADAGYAIESLDRFPFSPGPPVPPIPHVLGVARVS